jgi:hypothetical protein
LEDNAPQGMSREQWRERVAQAKRRVRQVAIEQRGRMSYQVFQRPVFVRLLFRLGLADTAGGTPWPMGF